MNHRFPHPSLAQLRPIVLLAGALIVVGASARSAGAAELPEVYVVDDGDTLTGISLRTGVAVDRLVELNALADPDQLLVGQSLRLAPPRSSASAPGPASAATPAASCACASTVVQPGDTLSAISRRTEVPMDRLVQLNGLQNPDRLFVGTTLLLPPVVVRSTVPEAQGTQSTAARAAAAAAAAPGQVESGAVVVQPGDTLSAISRRTGVSIERLTQQNRIADPNWLPVGTLLRLGSPPPRLPASSLATLAQRYLGSPYVFGGTTPQEGFDCSGLVYWVSQLAGRAVPRDIFGQYAAGSHPTIAQLQTGDLVFFQNTYMDGLSHNGIYLGNGRFLHAADESVGVTISNLHHGYWADHWYGATRLPS